MTQAITFIAQHGVYIVLFTILLGEMGIPILLPGEIVLFLAGKEIASTVAALVGLWLLLAAVDLTASLVLHAVCRRGGHGLLKRVLRRVSRSDTSPEERLQAWQKMLGHRYVLTIAGVRAVPGVRISASIVSGVLQLPFRSVVPGLAMGSLIWTAVPLAVGYAARNRLGTTIGLDREWLLFALAAVIVLGIGAGSIWWIRRSSRPAAGDAASWKSASPTNVGL